MSADPALLCRTVPRVIGAPAAGGERYRERRARSARSGSPKGVCVYAFVRYVAPLLLVCKKMISGLPQQHGLVAAVRCPRRLYGGGRYKSRAYYTLVVMIVVLWPALPRAMDVQKNLVYTTTGKCCCSVTLVVSLVASINRCPSVDIHKALVSVRASLSRVIVAESSSTLSKLGGQTTLFGGGSKACCARAAPLYLRGVTC